MLRSGEVRVRAGANIRRDDGTISKWLQIPGSYSSYCYGGSYPPASSWVILTTQTTRLPAPASCKLCGSVKKTVKVFFAGRDSFKQENCIAQHQFKSFQELGIESEGMYLSLSATKE